MGPGKFVLPQLWELWDLLELVNQNLIQMDDLIEKQKEGDNINRILKL